MPDVVLSPMGVAIRLTDERWAHIVEAHDDLVGNRYDVLETVKHPDMVVAGRAGELLAIRGVRPARWLVVVYRELNGDGFIIIAYSTSRTTSLRRRGQVWL